MWPLHGVPLTGWLDFSHGGAGLPKVQKLPRFLRPITGRGSLLLHAADKRESQARFNTGREPGVAHWGPSLETSYGTIIALLLPGEKQRCREVKQLALLPPGNEVL